MSRRRGAMQRFIEDRLQESEEPWTKRDLLDSYAIHNDLLLPPPRSTGSSMDRALRNLKILGPRKRLGIGSDRLGKNRG